MEKLERDLFKVIGVLFICLGLLGYMFTFKHDVPLFYQELCIKGVQYIRDREKGAVMPLLDKEGKPLQCEVKNDVTKK